MTPEQRRARIDYTSLTPHARLLLALSAMAREDQPTLQRIWATAPQELVSMQGAELAEQIRMVREIGLLFLRIWHVGVHDWLAGTLARERASDDALLEQAGKVKTRGLLTCLALVRGYEGFCDRAQLPADEILRVSLGPVAGQVRDWREGELKTGLELAGDPDSAMAGMIREAAQGFEQGFGLLWPAKFAVGAATST